VKSITTRASFDSDTGIDCSSMLSIGSDSHIFVPRSRGAAPASPRRCACCKSRLIFDWWQAQVSRKITSTKMMMTSTPMMAAMIPRFMRSSVSLV
jgi:hypothetical protein